MPGWAADKASPTNHPVCPQIPACTTLVAGCVCWQSIFKVPCHLLCETEIIAKQATYVLSPCQNRDLFLRSPWIRLVIMLNRPELRPVDGTPRGFSEFCRGTTPCPLHGGPGRLWPAQEASAFQAPPEGFQKGQAEPPVCPLASFLRSEYLSTMKLAG